MLKQLRVKNLALVEQIRIEFGPGLNVITGETGAGKSIIIGALGLVLGERADRGLIRAGEEACGVEANFELPDSSDVDAILDEYGIDVCSEGQLIIRRIVKANGTTQNFLNDHSVTLQVLKKIGDILVDMHGPHDHQSLFKQEFQLELLDAYGHLWDVRAHYEDCYQQLRALEERREQLEGGELVEEQIDLHSYRVKEIEDAALEEGEEDDLASEHQVVGHAQRIMELGSLMTQALTENEGSAFDNVAQAQRAIEELDGLHPDAVAWQEEIKAISVQLQELSRTIQGTLENIDADPARLEWLDQRLATYRAMKRKYAPTVGEILEICERSKQKLEDLQHRDEKIEALSGDIRKCKTELESHGTILREKRLSVAVGLAEEVTRGLQVLGFENGRFAVDLMDVEPRSSGMDEIEFGFAPNVGEPMRALRSIASSGEISRVMLATKVVLARHDRIPLMVFDEIDANVGGEMGTAVGRKLAEVAQNHQVICITHLPQVAVFGAHHFAVHKSVRGERTFTDVAELDDIRRVDEVARMLGGSDQTEVAVDHARALLESV